MNKEDIYGVNKITRRQENDATQSPIGGSVSAGDVVIQVRQMNENIEALRAMIVALESQMSPVLLPEIPMPKDCVPTSRDVDHRSPLADALTNLNGVLYDIRNTTESILKRLQV